MPFSTTVHMLRTFAVPVLVSALVIACFTAGPAGAQEGALFPEPFVAEHHLVQTEADGSRFESETVTDYYGGSWIVSVRPDGSRVVVDLADREITEIRPDRGVYWTVTFDRLGDLADRLDRAERLAPRAGSNDGESGGGAGVAARSNVMADEASEPPDLVVEDVDGGGALAARSRTGGERPAVRRLRIVERERQDEPDAGMEIWVDPSVRLRPAALTALRSFESVLGAPRGPGQDAERPSVDRYVAAARAHAAGAVPVRTERTVARGPESARVRIEDVTTRLERVDDFPEELVVVPEGLRRVPHPLEGMVTFLEAEKERDRALGGRTAETTGSNGEH